MAEIIKVLREHLPALRLVGKRYTDDDRKNGGFAHKWDEWFANGWFAELERLGEAKDIENGYLGFMRCDPGFEYWIGMFVPVGTEVPEGYGYIDLPESDVGLCWIQGRHDDWSIYGMHDQCMSKLREHGMASYRTDENGRCFFFERYNCPRFTGKDEQGRVILDYGVYLA